MKFKSLLALVLVAGVSSIAHASEVVETPVASPVAPADLTSQNVVKGASEKNKSNWFVGAAEMAYTGAKNVTGLLAGATAAYYQPQVAIAAGDGALKLATWAGYNSYESFAVAVAVRLGLTSASSLTLVMAGYIAVPPAIDLIRTGLEFAAPKAYSGLTNYVAPAVKTAANDYVAPALKSAGKAVAAYAADTAKSVLKTVKNLSSSISSWTSGWFTTPVGPRVGRA